MILRTLFPTAIAPVSVEGKTIWIIGASSGLGAALAQVLAEAGAQIGLSARRQDALEAVRRSLAGDGHCVAPLDVTDLPSMRRAQQKLLQQWERIDVVVYCSGIRPVPQWSSIEAAEQLHGLDVNLGGVFRLLELMMPLWQRQGGGDLLLIGSLIATGAMPLAGVYGASKAGLAYLAENLRMDLAEMNVRVQLASPGFIETPLTAFRPRRQMPCLMQPLAAARALHRLMGRDDVFEIHFPKRLSLPTKIIHWVLPRHSWMQLLMVLEKRTRKTHT